MEKQKICIVGGGLTGLITAATLGKLNLQIDLITGNLDQDIKSNRTIAISENNLNFLKKLNIFKSTKKEFWPCTEMQLYSHNKKKLTKIFEFKNNKKEKKILYMTKNANMMKDLLINIKKNKLISLKKNSLVSEINSSGLLKIIKYDNKISPKYNLIIICAGNNSQLVKNIFDEKILERSYEEISGTTIIEHKAIQNNIARQFFLNEGILALLPISNKKTSIVWSLDKNLMHKYKLNNNSLFKKKIKFYINKYIEKVKFNETVEFRNLNLSIRQTYYKDRILLFGDALHVVHPMVGQGFNMTLRDLIGLEKHIKNKIDLGLDIGDSSILSEFTDKIKSTNFIHSMGINLIKDVFSVKKESLKQIRDRIISHANQNDFLKGLFFNIADKGIKF